jgi:hypothetical protein
MPGKAESTSAWSGGPRLWRKRPVPGRWIAIGGILAIVALSMRSDDDPSIVADRAITGPPRLTSSAGVVVPAAVEDSAADSATAPRGPTAEVRVPTQPTQVEMKNVYFHVDEDIALRIRHLRGTMRSKNGGPIMFDDKSSFIIRVRAAEVGLTGPELTALLNKYVFAYRGAPLRDLTLRIENNEIVQKGRMKKGFWIPFEIHASVSITPDGRIRMHPTKTKAAGINAASLMKVFGLHLDDLLNLKGSKGATVEGNDILLDPEMVMPPPSIEGRVTGIRIEGDELVQVFGTAATRDSLPALSIPDRRAPNYMFYRGGTLRFGKLLMLDADMQIVDMDPKDPFRFFLDRYNDQLIPGYSKNLRDQGLEVFMRDIDDVPR